MTRRPLPTVTLIGIDCVNTGRLQLAADICQEHFDFAAVKLLSSIDSADRRFVRVPPINSRKEYSHFVVRELDRFVDTPHALLIQHDGFILNPDAWTEEFLRWDFIGAPWPHWSKWRVGNGGFSLRSKKLIALLAAHHAEIGDDPHPEDRWICHTARPFLESRGIAFAPEALAATFSLESSADTNPWDGQFGFHDLRCVDISRWLRRHPEYELDPASKALRVKP